MTWKILTEDTNKIIYWSAVRPRHDPSVSAMPYLSRGEIAEPVRPPKPIVEIVSDKVATESGKPKRIFEFQPDDLLGRTYLTDKNEYGECFRATIVRKITERDEQIEGDEERIKFLVRLDDEEKDKILSYNELLDIVEAQYAEELDEENLYWKFKRIAAHEGPLSPKHPRYNGSAYNVLIEWEDGTSTYEPLDIVAKDDPVTCATYAKENGLLDTPGWKRFKRLASRKDKYIRMCKAAKRKSLREGDVYKFGVQIPRHVKQAKEIDAKNNNTFWQDAMDHELAQLHKFNTFHDLGICCSKPDGYQMTKVH